MTPYILIQSTRAPYSTSSAIDAYEAALAASNLGLRVKYVFIDKGIHQLNVKQQGLLLSHKNMAKKLSALPLFDVEELYVLSSSNTVIEDLVLEDEIKFIDHEEFTYLCENASQILVF